MPLSEKNQAEVLVGAVIAAAREVADTIPSLDPALCRLRAACDALDRHVNEQLAKSRWNEKRRGRR